MSIAFYCLSGFFLLVALGTGAPEDRNGWLLVSGLYAIAGALA